MKKNLFYRLCCAVIVLYVFSGNIISNAQQPDSVKHYDLDEVVITGTRLEENIYDIGRSITVITEEEINQSVYANVGDLLSVKEGINIVGSAQNPGSTQSIYLRGTSSGQSVVMIDGIRITDPSSVENTFDLSELSLSNIKRIEIVRGSHSTYYGSSAIGGVINIITLKNQEKGFHIDAEGRAGTFGKNSFELTERIFLNYSTGNGFYINSDLFNSNINGLDAVIDTVTDVNKKNIDKDNFKKTDYSLKAGFINSNWDTYFSFRNTDQRVDIDDGAFKNDDNYFYDLNRKLYTYGLKYNFNKNVSLKYYGGYSEIYRVAIDDSSIIDDIGNYDQAYVNYTYQSEMLNNEIQTNIRFDNLSAFIGGSIYKETMTSDFYTYSNSMWGLYISEVNLDTLKLLSTTSSVFAHIDIQGDIISSFLENFSLAGGMRYNYHKKFGGSFTCEISPSYKIWDNSLIYLSYSTGFNTPSLYRMYFPSSYYTSGITRGNPDLKPEESNSLEVGYKQKISDNTLLSFSVYTTKIKNAVEYVYLWDNSIGIDTLGNDWMRDDHRGDTYINVGEIDIQGMEIAVSYKPFDKLVLMANASLLKGQLEYDPSNIDTEQTQGNLVQLYSNGAFLKENVKQTELVRRTNNVNFSIMYMPINKLSVKTDIKYIGPRTDVYYDMALGPWGALGTKDIDNYILVDLTLNYKITKYFTIKTKIENIFNIKYTELLGYTIKQRGFYVTLNYTI